MNTRWLLALESSTQRGGAALLRDGELVGIAWLEEGLRHGRELAPAAQSLLQEQGVSAADLHAVAVSAGPGSYTGIRVGVMTAKALAYAAGCRLAAVSSLAVLAHSVLLAGDAAPGDLVAVMQDARRDEVYFGLYRVGADAPQPVQQDAALAPEEAAALLAAHPDVICAGSGFATYAELFGQSAKVSAAAASPAAVGALAWRNILQEKYADPLEFQPVYLRRDEGADWRHDALITQK